MWKFSFLAMSITFSFRYNSSSLRFGLIPWQFQNKMFKPKGYLSWMMMHYSGLFGGFMLSGDSLGGFTKWRGGFYSEWFCGGF